MRFSSGSRRRSQTPALGTGIGTEIATSHLLPIRLPLPSNDSDSDVGGEFYPKALPDKRSGARALKTCPECGKCFALPSMRLGGWPRSAESGGGEGVPPVGARAASDRDAEGGLIVIQRVG